MAKSATMFLNKTPRPPTISTFELQEELRGKIRKEKLRGPPKPRPDVFKNRKGTRSYTKAQQES